MSNMVKEYGAKKGKSVFYATANKQNQKPSLKDMMVKHKMAGRFKTKY